MKRKTVNNVVFDWVIYIALAIVLFITIYPFYNILIISLNSGKDTAAGSLYWWPRMFTLENYKAFFADSSWLSGIAVSVLRTVLGTAIGLGFTTLVAYGLAYRELAFRKTYMTIIIISMYFSGGIIPFYVLLQQTHLLNNFLVYIIPGALNLFFLLVGISFFQEISPSLRESALIDGANDIAIFVKIVIPISMPFIATLILFLGVSQWNNWFDTAFFMMKRPDLRTLSYLMMQVIVKTQVQSSLAGASADAAVMGMRSNGVTPLSIQAAAMMFSIAPIVCVYPFLQKYFVKGIMLGSVKE